MALELLCKPEADGGSGSGSGELMTASAPPPEPLAEVRTEPCTTTPLGDLAAEECQVAAAASISERGGSQRLLLLIVAALALSGSLAVVRSRRLRL